MSSPSPASPGPDGPEAIDARGLPSVAPPDPHALENERTWLREMSTKPRPVRYLGFLRRGGPGYLQAALTLGGGSASASLLAGAAFGYELLWVAPLSMLLGLVMLMAIAHQTLSTGQRPFTAMKVHAGPVFAYGWAIAAALASIIWHFAQYALASSLGQELFRTGGIDVSRTLVGVLILIWAIVSAQLFASGSSGMAWFDRVLRILIWGIVLCFAWTVAQTGVDWPRFWDGLLGFSIPERSAGGIDGFATMMAGLGAAVVVNMVFLYPYSLLARGWGKEHRKLARFDLFAGMLIPYCLATGLMILATANSIHATGTVIDKSFNPLDAAQALRPTLGDGVGNVVFLLGLLGMVLSTITMHMVSASFALSEMFNLKFGSKGYRLAMLAPVPGFLGCLYWSDLAFYVAIPTSIAGGVMLPLVYFAFTRLQASKRYLGADRPSGWRQNAVVGAMSLVTLIVACLFGYFLYARVL